MKERPMGKRTGEVLFFIDSLSVVVDGKGVGTLHVVLPHRQDKVLDDPDLFRPDQALVDWLGDTTRVGQATVVAMDLELSRSSWRDLITAYAKKDAEKEIE